MTTNNDLTWEEFKEFSRKYGAKTDGDGECISFGLLEFDKEGFISWYGEIICPVRTYKQMKVIIENMFC